MCNFGSPTPPLLFHVFGLQDPAHCFNLKGILLCRQISVDKAREKLNYWLTFHT